MNPQPHPLPPQSNPQPNPQSTPSTPLPPQPAPVSPLHLPRKVDQFLLNWKNNPDHLPLIIKGARQIGKTHAIRHFARRHYPNIIEIDFALQPQYRTIFDDGFAVDTILKNISLIDPSLTFLPGRTLIFFDELQKCPNCATSLKSFREDGRYDVICSGSLLGLNYQEIESNGVGNKTDYQMHSLDFEEFLWAKGYQPHQIDSLLQHMLTLTPFSSTELSVMFDNFKDYMVIGGMPALVKSFILHKNYEGILSMQQQILLDYEEDITKYAQGLEQARILSVYHKIPVFLGNENKKFQISKVNPSARNREYIGIIDWLKNAGIINPCYCLDQVSLPLKGNYNPDNYRLYFADTGLLIGSLDEEAQADLRNNQNFNAYKGAIYENIIAEFLVKSGYSLYFYKNDKSTIEMDFFIRDSSSLIPVKVKAVDGSTPSLNRLVTDSKYPDITYGIKLSRQNLGFNGHFYTFPYFLTFLLKKFLANKPQPYPATGQ